MSNYAVLTSKLGNLILLGFEKEKTGLFAWGCVTDTPTPAGTLYTFESETYQSETAIPAELCVFGVEDDPPYTQLTEPVIFRKVVTYGR